MNSLDLVDIKADLELLVIDLEVERQHVLKLEYGGATLADIVQGRIDRLQGHIDLIKKELSSAYKPSESTNVNVSTEAYLSFDKAAREA